MVMETQREHGSSTLSVCDSKEAVSTLSLRTVMLLSRKQELRMLPLDVKHIEASGLQPWSRRTMLAALKGYQQIEGHSFK
jgi:hypothetical protein